ncbi:FK506-binding protein 15 [Phytophthora cinnamomi]|uniref:FK506-binding protein 15 n=1 Tax=Phytophthora cinnamomi TaxID=4785 RepID=UPI0035595435|nr:FK506-binding protein 15 [Phytophthora cinnamomi]
MSSNPSARLTGIFQDASASGGGNDALRYTAPREPSHKQQQQQQAAAPAAAAPASSVVYSTMVSLYQYDASARKYVQLGGATAGSKAAVGCVLVGAETSYNLLFYNAAKQHLCAVPVKFGVFKPTLQAKSYVNFYDEQGLNWSVKFPSDAQVAEFMRQVFLAKIHVEIWGSDKTVTKTNPSALIQDDLVFVKPETQQVSNGDTVAVAFSAWRVVGNANSAPADVVTKYPPFEKAGEGDLRKIRLGDSSERIKALEEGIVGMRKGGKRIVLAPPGKTNGQDWYLLEIELLKTKTGHGATQRKSVPAVNTAAATEEAPKAATERKTSRRRSTPSSISANSTAAAASRSNSTRNLNDRNDAARNGDLVPYEEDPNSAAAKNEMELKELRLLQREQQLELQARALERERMSVTGGGGGGFGSMGFGLGGGFNSSFPSSSTLFNNSALSGGRPVDAMLSELNAKVDYLIRMAPGNSSNSASGIGAGPSDVAAVIRGVERLAGENDRLLTQINSQHQQQSSYEKRCEELLEQNQRLQDEKRTLQERYQSAASSQLNVTSELSALASARDAAVTQTNRLHAEYQQLLTAYYQLQQQQGASNEAEEHKQALNFEREARARAEKQLTKETQARSLAEQELALTKKQHDVALQVKSSELSTASAQLEQQVRSLQTQLQKVNDDRVRLQTHAEEQAQRLAALSESKERDAKQQLERAAQQVAHLQQDNQDLTGKLDVSSARVHKLEAELELKAATPEASAEADSALAAEEKRLFVEQIELLQQKVKDLEQEKYEQVQEALASGRLSSSGPSPRGQKTGFEGECEKCAAVKDREQAAERALAAAEAIKREAQDMLAVAAHTGGGADERERLVSLFKESVNEMFFRFQDLFEEETAVDGKQVLTAIRKVLKSSTKSIIQQLQVPPLQQDTETEAESDGNMSDGPPAPPPQEIPVVQAAASVAAVAETVAAVEAAVVPAEDEPPADNGHSAEEKSTPVVVAATADEKHSAEAKVEVVTEAAPSATPADASIASAPVLHAPQYPSSDESDSDADFQG